MRSSPLSTRQVSGWYVPLPDYTPGFYMPEASAGAVKNFRIEPGERKVKR